MAEPTEQNPVPQFWIVSGGGDNVMRVWEMPTATHRSSASIVNLERTISSRDTRLLAMLDNAGNVRIISVQPTQINVVEKDVAAWKIEGGISSLAFVRRAGTVEPNADNLKDSYNVLIGTPDGSVQLWSLAEQKMLSVWKAGSSPIRSVAGSVDGTLAVSGADDGSTYLWKMNHPASVPLETSAGETFAVTVTSPSRKQIASTGVKDGQPAIVIRSTETNKITHVLSGHAGSILSLAFSNDEARLVSGGDDRTLRIWDLRNAAAPELKKIEGLAANATALGSNADGSQILAGFADNSLKLFNTADGMVLKEFAGHTAAVAATGFWNNQPYSVSLDSTVRFWNAADGTQTRAFNLAAPPTTVAVSNDGQRMVFGGTDNKVLIYQTDNGGVLQTLQGFAAAATGLNFSADAQLLSVVNADGRVSIFNAATGRLREAFVDSKVKSALFNANASGVFVARAVDGMTVEPMRFLQHLDGSTQPIRATAFHPNNQTVYVAVADGALRGHSVQNGQTTFSTSHGAAINDLAISMDGQVLATAGDNNVVRLWNASGAAVAPQQLAGFTGPVRRVAFSTDARQILAVADGEKPTAQLHDLPTGTLLQKFSGHAGTAAGCVLLPPVMDAVSQIPGTMALTASPSGVYQWNVASWKQIAGHNGIITSLARVPKTARQVFSGSLDNTIRRWNLDNGQTMQQYNHGGGVHAIAVSPEGDRLASASDNRTAKLFNINGPQIAELRSDIRRRIALTRAQQMETASNARLNVAKQQADVAEKDLPVKTAAEKTLADMLAAATADVQTKKTAMETTFTEKTVAEKAAIDASSAAKTAMIAKTMAEQSAKDAAAAVTVVQAKLTRLTQASNAEPQNESLKQKLAAAQAEMEAATTKSTQIAAAVQAPTDVATQMATLANDAAKKLETVQKPYNDAVAALKTAEAAQNLLSQQQAVAAKELQTATELVPIRKEAVTHAEALLAEAKVAVEAANKSLQESDLPQRSVAFSPDGSVLVTSGDFGSLHTWDGKTGGAIGSFAGHTGPVKSVTFLDDKTLASASDDQSIRIWDANPGWILERTIGSQDDSTTIAHRVTAVDFSADSSQLLVAGGIPSRRGELQVFNTVDGSRTFSLPQAHDDVVYAARFSPDGKRIASGGADKYLRTFDVASSQQIRRFEGHTSYVLGVAWKRDGQLLASAGADNTVKVWNAETGDQQRTIETFRRHVTAVQFIGETDNIVTSCGDKQMRIHNAANGGQVRIFNTPTSWLHTVGATPDNAVAAAGDANGNVYLWNGNNGQQLRVLGVQPTEK
jgi:WD40 repeat protein